MLIYEGKCKRFGQKLLLRLTGSIFVNSDKIQLWQHKVTPFPVRFWVWFGSLGTLSPFIRSNGTDFKHTVIVGALNVH